MATEVDLSLPCLICGDEIIKPVLNDSLTVENLHFVDLRAKFGIANDINKLNNDTIFQSLLKLFKVDVFETSKTQCSAEGDNDNPSLKFCGGCRKQLDNLLELQFKLDLLKNQILIGIQYLKGKMEMSERIFESKESYKCYASYRRVIKKINFKGLQIEEESISKDQGPMPTNQENPAFESNIELEHEPDSPSTPDFHDLDNNRDEFEDVEYPIQEPAKKKSKISGRTFRKFVEDPENKLLIYGDKWNANFPAFTFQLLESTEGKDGQVQCTHCDLILPYHKETIRRHVAKVHTERFTCPHCPSRFSRGTSLRVHVQSVHEGQRIRKFIDCKTCGKPIVVGKRKQHEWTHKSMEEKEEARRDPSAADVPWNRRRTLEREKTFQCESCECRFSSLANLQRHQERMHQDPAERRELCTECGKTFLNLRIHMRDKHSEDNGVVDLMKTCLEPGCGRRFICLGKLTQHKNQVHRKLRPWKCTKCGKGFGNKWNLKQHVKVTH